MQSTRVDLSVHTKFIFEKKSLDTLICNQKQCTVSFVAEYITKILLSLYFVSRLHGFCLILAVMEIHTLKWKEKKRNNKVTEEDT